jgi:hypothetical protein
MHLSLGCGHCVTCGTQTPPSPHCALIRHAPSAVVVDEVHGVPTGLGSVGIQMVNVLTVKHSPVVAQSPVMGLGSQEVPSGFGVPPQLPSGWQTAFMMQSFDGSHDICAAAGQVPPARVISNHMVITRERMLPPSGYGRAVRGTQRARSMSDSLRNVHLSPKRQPKPQPLPLRSPSPFATGSARDYEVDPTKLNGRPDQWGVSL